MSKNMDSEITNDLAQQLEADLLNQYGPLLRGDNLRIVLGYPTMAAMHQAMLRKTIPVPLFKIENRRGRFALAKDVARWLAERRQRVEEGN